MAESRLRRFSRGERTLHWINAAAFFALLTTGLILYVPALSDAVGRRGTIKTIHLYVALAWVLALALTLTPRNRRDFAATRRELERLDADDKRWLAGWPAPQGRFNAGQKLHAITQAAYAVLFAGSGLLLWLGERNTALRFPGTIVLHDGLTYTATALVVAHLYLAVVAPATRPALRGMTRGDVGEAWATAHHVKWVSEVRGEGTAVEATPGRWPRPGVRRTLIGTGVAIVAFSLWTGLGTTSHEAAPGQPRIIPPPVSSGPPILNRGMALARQAVLLDDAGNLKQALPLYAQAVSLLPGAAEIRSAYGSALARSRRTADAVTQLQQAVTLDPSAPTPRVYLAAELIQQHRLPQARFQLGRALALNPAGPAAAAARKLLAATASQSRS